MEREKGGGKTHSCWRSNLSSLFRNFIERAFNITGGDERDGVLCGETEESRDGRGIRQKP